MKLRVAVDGQDYTLDLQQNGADSEYRLDGVVQASGSASISEITPGVFSVLLGARSFLVHIARRGEDLEVWTGTERHRVSITDARDRSAGGKKVSTAGPMEIRALMPGKVVKLLARPGDQVQAGQGVIVVEAMKMQNEMKAPKDGTVSKILVEEGATVIAGETLIVIE